MNNFIKWWMTPEFPEIHLNDPTSKIKIWFFHPLKRRLAKFYLKFLQRFSDIKVIAITGSAGKTSTKELLVSILKIKGKVSYSVANIDPVYNIPTTILKTTFGTKYLVLEMGVEYPSEMDFYLWMVKPDIGVITNIFPTHLKFMKSLEGVLSEKGKLVKSLEKNQTAILTHGDKMLQKLSKDIIAKKVWVKKSDNPFIQNGYIASFIASELGISIKDIKKGIVNASKPPHRMNLIELKSGALVFDDSYNSNPEAFLSALKMFIDKAGKNEKVAVVGDMLELGHDEEKFHKEIGVEISKYDFRAVIGVGPLSKFILKEIKIRNKYTKTYHLNDYSEVVPVLSEYLIKDFYIFIKGSRSIGLDKVVDKLV